MTKPATVKVSAGAAACPARHAKAFPSEFQNTIGEEDGRKD